MAILVTGATGFVGTHLVNRIIKDKIDSVYVLTRDHSKIPEVWNKQLSVLTSDLSRCPLELPSDVRIVFHCGGEVRDRAKFQDTNVNGTFNVVRACIKASCKLIYLSSVGVMGARKPGLVYETDKCFPEGMYERSKYDAEEIIKNAVISDGLRSFLLRPSIVYGPGIHKGRDSFLSLARAIRNGNFCTFGETSSFYNIVYVGDVVEALIHLSAFESKSSGEVFILNDPIEWRIFAQRAASILGVKQSNLSLPSSLGYILAYICDAVGLFGIKVPFSTNRYKALTCKTIFSSKKICNSIDFKFKYGNAEGIKITLENYRKQGLL